MLCVRIGGKRLKLYHNCIAIGFFPGSCISASGQGITSGFIRTQESLSLMATFADMEIAKNEETLLNQECCPFEAGYITSH